MPRGITTLEAMVEDLRLETGRSANANFGLDEYDSLVRILQRTQEDLYWDHDWSFLKCRRDIELEAGSRYYDFPTDLNYERIQNVRVKNGGVWQPVHRGIKMENEYSTIDSDTSTNRQDPVQKWDVIIAEGETTEQCEVWPIPATDGGTLRFTGFKKLNTFIADSATCTLDDNLIVLFAAAKILSRDKAEDAKEALMSANKRFNNLKRGDNRAEMGTPMSGQAANARSGGVIVIAPEAAG